MNILQQNPFSFSPMTFAKAEQVKAKCREQRQGVKAQELHELRNKTGNLKHFCRCPSHPNQTTGFQLCVRPQVTRQLETRALGLDETGTYRSSRTHKHYPHICIPAFAHVLSQNLSQIQMVQWKAPGLAVALTAVTVSFQNFWMLLCRKLIILCNTRKKQ